MLKYSSILEIVSYHAATLNIKENHTILQILSTYLVLVNPILNHQATATNFFGHPKVLFLYVTTNSELMAKDYKSRFEK